MTIVAGIDTLQIILSTPMWNRIGLFLDESLDCLKLQSVIDAIRDPSVDSSMPPTVIVPTHPMVVRGHWANHGDLIFEDPRSSMSRVLYQETLRGPMQGLPGVINRAVILPTYLYETGAASCFNICFVFCEQEVGEEVIARSEQTGTETVFVSLPDLRSTKL